MWIIQAMLAFFAWAYAIIYLFSLFRIRQDSLILVLLFFWGLCLFSFDISLTKQYIWLHHNFRHCRTQRCRWRQTAPSNIDHCRIDFAFDQLLWIFQSVVHYKNGPSKSRQQEQKREWTQWKWETANQRSINIIHAIMSYSLFCVTKKNEKTHSSTEYMGQST